MPSIDDAPIMMFANALTGWTRWWAWHPVETWDCRWRWLGWVERRLMHKKPHLPGALGNPWWQHRIVSSDRPEAKQ